MILTPNYSGYALMIPLPLGIVQTSLTLLSLTRGIPNLFKFILHHFYNSLDVN